MTLTALDVDPPRVSVLSSISNDRDLDGQQFENSFSMPDVRLSEFRSLTHAGVLTDYCYY
jgi:hypothetical protein